MKRPQPSCKAKAIDFLSRSDQSIKKLTEKLKRKAYTSEEIEDTINWLKEKHYLNEEEGCRRKFNYLYQESSASVKQICLKLQQQGYDRYMIQDCVPEDTYRRELQVASKLMHSKYKIGTDYKKMMQGLYLKGFGYDVANAAIEAYMAQWEELEE